MLASVTVVLGSVVVEECPVVCSVDVDVAAARELVSGRAADDDAGKCCEVLALLVDVTGSDVEVDAAAEVLAAALLDVVESSAGCLDVDAVLAMLLAPSVED